MSENMNKTSASSSTSVAGAAVPAEQDDFRIPSMEYELAENLEEVGPVEAEESLGIGTTTLENGGEEEVPRFEDFRHPFAKFYVTVNAVLCLILIMYVSLSNMIKKHSNVSCLIIDFPDHECSQADLTLEQIIELFFRVWFEVAIPLAMLLTFLGVKMIHTISPSLARSFNDPTPGFAPLVAIIIAYKFYLSVSTAMNSAPVMSKTSNSTIWLEYITTSALTIFWVVAFINIHVFAKLCSFNQIRVREMHERIVV